VSGRRREDQRLAHRRVDDAVDDPVAVCPVAVPGIRVEATAGACRQLHLREEDLLTQHVPPGLRRREAFQQPTVLPSADQGGRRIVAFDTVGPELVATGLVGAVRPGVDHVERRQTERRNGMFSEYA
jgi:hypothetical protein